MMEGMSITVKSGQRHGQQEKQNQANYSASKLKQTTQQQANTSRHRHDGQK